MITIPTLPGTDTIGVYKGGFNEAPAGAGINYYLLVDPASTQYLVSPIDNDVYLTNIVP